MAQKFRVLVTGCGGQLGQALMRQRWPEGFETVGFGRRELDIRSAPQIDAALEGGDFDAVVNAAAYTAVDRAETDKGEAFMVNHGGAINLANACARHGSVLIHVSSDYVFDGAKPTAYVEGDGICPLSIYGHSKAAGEVAVRIRLPNHIILRTAWLFSAQGQNFVRKILGLARERDELCVVADQRGSPTSAADLAKAIVGILDGLFLRGGAGDDNVWGTYHCVNAGGATWRDLAEQAVARGTRHGAHRPAVLPITSKEYPLPAPRPANSQLDCAKLATAFGIRMRPWQDALAPVVNDILEESHR